MGEEKKVCAVAVGQPVGRVYKNEGWKEDGQYERNRSTVVRIKRCLIDAGRKFCFTGMMA